MTSRFPALSGVAFAVLLVCGWFLSGGDAPNYTAADLDELGCRQSREKRRRSVPGRIRSVLGRAETTIRGSAQLARV